MPGGQFIYSDLTATAKTTKETGDLSVFRICPVAFYEWEFIRKAPRWHLMPWASDRFDLLREEAAFPVFGQTYQSAFANFAMGLNLGYAF